MITSTEAVRRLGVLCLVVATWSTSANAIVLDYCSTLNTAETSRNISIYQTNGLCSNFCVDDYAYAITQDNSCWCSNYAPAKSVQKSISSCDTPCPAYPSEYCGGDGLYGYIILESILPSGTESATSSTNTVTVVPTESSESSTITSSSAQETSSASSSSSSSSTTKAPSSSLVQTVTAGGTIKTVTIAPTQQSTGETASDSSGITVNHKGLNTGQVVGIVVGIIGAVIIAAGLALFFFFRRKKQRKEEDFQDDPSIRGSSSGMVASGRPDMSMTNGSPSSPAAASNRNSALQIDPRMDPFKQGLYVRSASHESINTLRDDHDYSRKIQAPKVLRATNPDPEPGT